MVRYNWVSKRHDSKRILARGGVKPVLRPAASKSAGFLIARFAYSLDTVLVNLMRCDVDKEKNNEKYNIRNTAYDFGKSNGPMTNIMMDPTATVGITRSYTSRSSLCMGFCRMDLTASSITVTSVLVLLLMLD